MDWITGIQQAIDYIEEHIIEEIDYEEVAKRAYSSSFHFQRVFGIMCGFTLGEYIRMRRLTLAGSELLKKRSKIIDLAFKYGYGTPESFSRAFASFHGIIPSKVKNSCFLKSFSRLNVKIDLIGGNILNYRIEEKSEIILIGFKKHFTGVPYGEERARQEEEFATTTRAKQWLLIGASQDYCTDYCIVTNIDDNGYDFYIAYDLNKWTQEALFNSAITGVDFIDKLGFEKIIIQRQTYAVFQTEKMKKPISEYIDIRKRIVTEWLPSSDYFLAEAPEIVALHWRPNGIWEKERYVEILLPIEKK